MANTRTSQNSGTWFTANISTRVVIDSNTIKIVCIVPPGSALVNEDIKEICVFAKDSLNVDFLLAVGQPTEQIIYDPSGTITLELQISLADIDLTSTYVFNNTIATELESHTTDPNAHPEIAKALAENGIFIEAGAYTKERMGQAMEFPVEFDGTKASFTHGGVTFTAKYNGTELNTKTITFDGVKTTDELRADFNALWYPNTVEHNGTGSEVLSAIVKTLTGGTYVVLEDDICYKDTDGVYKQAIADGTDKSNVAGFALRSKKTIVCHGVGDINTGYAANTPLYLSGSLAGKFTNFNTNLGVGLSLGDHIFFTGYAGDITLNASQNFDAVVTDAAGLGQFATTQAAINYVPNNGRILINKLELVKSTIDTNGKNLTIIANNSTCGWKRFLGLQTQFAINFSGVPTQGTWRIEWNGQETNDIAFNANAATVQTEFNLLNGHNGVTVSGNYSIGFTVTFSDNQTYALPTFSYVGRNEIQRFTFSDVPDDGTVRFSFLGNETVNYAYNDSLAQLQTAFDNLASTNSVVVTGSFAAGFNIEFTGGWLSDGNKEQPLILAVANLLTKLAVPVVINGDAVLTVDATVVQKGKTPASNLYNGVSLLTITPASTIVGEVAGPNRLMNVDASILAITGNVILEDFREGIVLESTSTIFQLQARNIGTDKPVLSLNKLPTVNYDIELAGYAKDIVAQLRLTEHTTNKKRVMVSGVDFTLPSGVTISKDLSALKAKFTGAEIDFSLGKVYAQDGTTDIGIDFVVPVITPTFWKWYSVNLSVSGINATNESTVNLLILPATAEGSSMELAPRPPLEAQPVGLVAIKGALGNKERTVITTTRDSFAHRLAGTWFILYHPSGSVGFWFSDIGGMPGAISGTSAQVEITTLTIDDYQATVATKIKNAIDAHAYFTASVVGNKVTVENTVLGSVTDADVGTTTFFKEVTVQGTNTDVTGIDDISNHNIVQFTLGGGSGSGGAGDITAFEESLAIRLNESYYQYATPLIFSVSKELQIASNTGTYNSKDATVDFQSGQLLTSVQMYNESFLLSKDEGNKIEVHSEWLNTSVIDSAAVYEASINGGLNWQTIPMSRVFLTTKYIGQLNFNSPQATRYTQAINNALIELNTTTQQSLSQKITVGEKNCITQIDVSITKTGSNTGSFTVKLCTDNVGVPGDTIISKTDFVSTLSNGANAYTLSGFKNRLVAGDYWVVIETDAVYKTSFVTTTTSISLGVNSALSGYQYNGATWSTLASSGMYFILSGHVYDLRLKITAGTNDVKLKALGVFFDEQMGGVDIITPNALQPLQQFFSFSGDLNTFAFNITAFMPDSRQLKVYDVTSGQVYVYPAFAIDGRNITFPSGTFYSAGNPINLLFDQTQSFGYDYSEKNSGLLTANRLGSTDANLDRSVAGRGILLRRPDGTLREISIDDSDNLIVSTV